MDYLAGLNAFSEKLRRYNSCEENYVFKRWTNTDRPNRSAPVSKHGWQKLNQKNNSQVRKDCLSVNTLTTMFPFCSVSKMVSSFLPKAFRFFPFPFLFIFAFFSTHIGYRIPPLQGYSLWKSLQSFFNPYGLYVACNVAKGLKGFERKGIKAKKTVCGFLLFCNKNHQPALVKDSSSFCLDHFLSLLFFFP